MSFIVFTIVCPGKVAGGSDGLIWVATLYLLPRENVFSEPCCRPTESSDRSRHHFLPVSGNKHALLRMASQESGSCRLRKVWVTSCTTPAPPCHQDPPGSMTALESPERPFLTLCGRHKTLPTGETWDAGCSSSSVSSSALPSPTLTVPPTTQWLP